MSAKLLRLACTAAVAAQAVLAPLPAVAAPDPRRSVSRLLTDFQRLYLQAERATETYNAAAERLEHQRAVVVRLDGELAHARLVLRDSRGDAGRLAREQYQNRSDLSPYLRLLLARDPQHALDEGHVIGRLARDRAEALDRLTGSEKRRDALARAARSALDTQLTLVGRQRKARDDVRARLADVERLLASLTPEQRGEMAALERDGVADAQRRLTASGALGDGRPPSRGGDRAVRYAMEQLGKPYRWGAAGPGAYDGSGLAFRAWEQAGTPIPRTGREQWARLGKVPLDRLRPGDLIVYFPEATHVALYAGGGKVVQAPGPGERVTLAPIAGHPILGAVRPDAAPAAAPGTAGPRARGTARPPAVRPR
ncbi:C40 family peptidase [Streptomyces sp. TG1A-8]|uniref:C40 family peptidase n=1 Tax=Streptomyces sp. TG1A-8 TaxID=3051385 RepID=UPI00265B917E|nr:C40 family peptidase [Streptomyces sp. TG1A-8]MDO0925741.1 C40 family peptidase [Streptomyces sp. TG1A-8]